VVGKGGGYDGQMIVDRLSVCREITELEVSTER